MIFRKKTQIIISLMVIVVMGLVLSACDMETVDWEKIMSIELLDENDENIQQYLNIDSYEYKVVSFVDESEEVIEGKQLKPIIEVPDGFTILHDSEPHKNHESSYNFESPVEFEIVKDDDPSKSWVWEMFVQPSFDAYWLASDEDYFPLVEHNGNNVLKMEPNEYLTFHQDNLKNFTIEMDVIPDFGEEDPGHASLITSLRYENNDNQYFFWFREDGRIRSQRVVDGIDNIDDDPDDDGDDNWYQDYTSPSESIVDPYHLKIEVEGDEARVYINDGAPYIFTDFGDLTSGELRLSCRQTDFMYIYNIDIYDIEVE